jgi:hypothetical protein
VPSQGPHLPERLEFQVVLSLVATEPLSREELEASFTRALDTMVEEARGVVFGPVGGVDFTRSTIELEFTVTAISPAVLYAKMGEVLRVLEHAGFEYEGSKEERLRLELQPA